MTDMLNSVEMKVFCENIALMLSIGVQTDEAAHLLAKHSESKLLTDKCRKVYQKLVTGAKLASAMREVGGFPEYAIKMVDAGTRTGRVQETLESLARYYDEEGRLMTKIRQSVSYPAITLCIMSLVLAFVSAAILPIFSDVYESMSGGISASSFSSVNIGIVIGWVALALTLVATLAALVSLVFSQTTGGRDRLMRMIRFLPGGKYVFYDLSLSRFTSVLSVYLAAGINTDDAMAKAVDTVEMPELRRRVDSALTMMRDSGNPRSIVQALAESGTLDTMQIRMLEFGMRSGRVDEVFDTMGEDLFKEAMDGYDAIVDKVEPMLSGFVTIAVGLTLIAVMLPLVGMMGSIG